MPGVPDPTQTVARAVTERQVRLDRIRELCASGTFDASGLRAVYAASVLEILDDPAPLEH